MTGKNREFEPSPNRQSQQQERWVKAAFYVGLFLLVGWLYYSSADSVVPAGRPPSNGPSTPAYKPAEERRPASEDSRPRPRDSDDRSDSPRADSPRPDSRDDDATERHSAKPANPSEERDSKLIVRNVRVTDEHGKVVYRGDVDLRPTLDRIERGKRLRFSHDGIVFENRERRLPKKPSGYYHEFVQPTPGDNGPGGQRIVMGRGGEVYYSSDHYHTFRRIR